MNNSFVSKETLNKILKELAAAEDVLLYAPVLNGKVLDFAEITDAEKIAISDDISYKSPKEAFMPQAENLMTFSEGGVLESAYDKKTVVFGAKPCDAEALRVLHAVLMTGKFQDPFFERRFENSVLIAVGCASEKPGCFCTERGFDKEFSDFSDIMLRRDEGGTGYTVTHLSGKGRELLSEFNETKGIEAAKRTAKAQGTGMKKLELDKSIEDRELFDIIDWDKATEICQGCGMCTFICPSCHCFDFKDVSTFSETKRYRCWDSCMYPQFTLHASGHNPRASVKERFRQRVLHKYLYINKIFGYTACTGCGRCIRSCPAGMNIKKIVESIMEVLP
ncbi:MAG: 4Fe-4S dicluster domain-containing protein [Clostridiales bacterium]|nr:4Fe-4S dicluster domain-containing protein [Clostridiales bacterium]